MNREAFFRLLRANEVESFSTKIPPDVGMHQKGIPSPENLIPIPAEEVFPLEETEPHPYVAPNSILDQFMQSQLECLSEQIIHTPQEETKKEKPKHPVFEIGREFDSIEEFILFKRCIAAKYAEESRKNGWEQPIKVCKDPICLNPAIPSFDYCGNHMYKSKVENPFLQQCTAIDENGCRCHGSAPAVNSGKCLRHKE